MMTRGFYILNDLQSDFTLGKTPWPVFIHIDSYQICVYMHVCVCPYFKNHIYIYIQMYIIVYIYIYIH